jgi:hypothetical protein
LVQVRSSPLHDAARVLATTGAPARGAHAERQARVARRTIQERMLSSRDGATPEESQAIDVAGGEWARRAR